MASLPSTGSDLSAVPEALRGMIVQTDPENGTESTANLANHFDAFEDTLSSNVFGDSCKGSLRSPCPPLPLLRHSLQTPQNGHLRSDPAQSTPVTQANLKNFRQSPAGSAPDRESLQLKSGRHAVIVRPECLQSTDESVGIAISSQSSSLKTRVKAEWVANSSESDEGSLAGNSEPNHTLYAQPVDGAHPGASSSRHSSGSRSASPLNMSANGDNAEDRSGALCTPKSACTEDKADLGRIDCALEVVREYGLDLTAEEWHRQDNGDTSASKSLLPWERLDPRHSVIRLARNVTGYGFYFGATDSPYPAGSAEESPSGNAAPAEQRKVLSKEQPRDGDPDANEEAGTWVGSYARRFRFHSVVRRNAENKPPNEVSVAVLHSASSEKTYTLCGCLRYATGWRKYGRQAHATGPGNRKELRPRQLRQLKCENAPPFLGPQREEHKSRTTLVLDLDETLVHSSFRPVPVSAFAITVEVEGKPHTIHVCKRPGVDRFLEVVSRLYEVVIFTASLQTYADPLIDLLDPKGLCPYRLFRSSCSHWKGLWIKDLENLGRDLRRVILVDNSPSAYLLQPWNALPIKSWFFNMADRELDDLTSILAVMATVEDVPAVLKETVGPSCRERVLQQLRLLGEVEDERDEAEWFKYCPI
ncbi:Dullard family phosphatase domain-containing protein [Toxoplasma gondii GT1]|uniref:Dullard family phosphatase domain-containing protein n=3 Tax=Toxoplasma gondii TaxID=5811 RepID=S7USD5_TOXGG|nr:Dullard family phosphatase domain-containing protein [Toxoplasma gondii GT1]KAF4639245.1 Dullard family phosphatase domain-containing protein [Toxoplasma gondii]